MVVYNCHGLLYPMGMSFLPGEPKRGEPLGEIDQASLVQFLALVLLFFFGLDLTVLLPIEDFILLVCENCFVWNDGFWRRLILGLSSAFGGAPIVYLWLTLDFLIIQLSFGKSLVDDEDPPFANFRN